MKNMLIVHGGAPTAVINASLYGAVTEAKKHPEVDHIYAAIGGSGAVIREQFLDMKTVDEGRLELLPFTPASAIGTSRDHLEPEDYEAIARVIEKYDIQYVFFNGGNGSMDACGKVAAQNPHISHSYYRPSPAEDWPYTFYTMIHGRSEQECLDVVRELAAAAPLGPYAVLRSLRELKKISMTYF